MINENSSAETLTDIPVRRNVDIGIYLSDLEKAATEDSFTTGRLYTIPDFTRDIIAEFIRIRDYHRAQGLPLLTPAQIAESMIS